MVVVVLVVVMLVIIILIMMWVMMMLMKIDGADAADDVTGDRNVGDFGGNDDDNVEDDVIGDHGDKGDDDGGESVNVDTTIISSGTPICHAPFSGPWCFIRIALFFTIL